MCTPKLFCWQPGYVFNCFNGSAACFKKASRQCLIFHAESRGARRFSTLNVERGELKNIQLQVKGSAHMSSHMAIQSQWRRSETNITTTNRRIVQQLINRAEVSQRPKRSAVDSGEFEVRLVFSEQHCEQTHAGKLPPSFITYSYCDTVVIKLYHSTLLHQIKIENNFL